MKLMVLICILASFGAFTSFAYSLLTPYTATGSLAQELDINVTSKQYDQILTYFKRGRAPALFILCAPLTLTAVLCWCKLIVDYAGPTRGKMERAKEDANH
jgi:hypothetical protein